MVVLAPGRRPWRTPPLAAGRRWTVGTPSDRRAASRRHPRCVGNPSGGVVVNGWCGSSRPRAARWRHPTRRLRPRWPSERQGVPTRRLGGSRSLPGHAGRHGATAFCTRRLLSTAPLATRRRAECAAEFARPRRVAGDDHPRAVLHLWQVLHPRPTRRRALRPLSILHPPAPSLRQASRSHFVLVASRSQVIGNKWGMGVTYLRLLQNDYDKGPVLAWSHAPHRRSSVALSIPHQRVPPLVGWLWKIDLRVRGSLSFSLSLSLSLSGHSDALDELGLNRCCF